MRSVLMLVGRAADRELLATVLGDAGYTVFEAVTGELAIEIARAEHPDVIIADILMPDVDGYEFVRTLRADSAVGNTPVVFYPAADAVEEVRRLADAFGIPHVLAKPCEPEDIVEVVAEALRSPPTLPIPLPAEAIYREHLRVLNAKLVTTVDELFEAKKQTDEARAQLETLLSTAPVGFGLVDREFRVRRINGTLAAINGDPIADQLGRTVAEIVPDLWPQIEPAHRHVLATGEAVVNRELTSRNPDVPGAVHVWLASYYPVRVNAEIIGIGIVVVDVTERHQAEEFRSVVMDNMAEGLYVLDSDNLVTFLNAAASKMLGWTEQELRGNEAHPIIHFQHADGSAFPEADCELLKVRTKGRAIRVLDDAFTRKDGSIMPVAYSAAPLLNGTNVTGVIVAFRDTTEERAERTRVQRELNALTWVGRIREALDEERFVLYSQPIVPLRGGQASVELLLRMVGRNGEIIPPGSFLPVAEKYGLIGEIDRWVITEAIRQAAGGRRVELNLSGESVGAGSDLLVLIEAELSAAGVEPCDIVFEITETGLIHDLEAGAQFARGLADLGCGIALDDFGTGYGSFNYLKHLPIGYLKIDTEFVRDLNTNSANQHLVKAIVSLAQAFGQQTIAEGVEDAQTLALLHNYGVDFAQGFHLGRPAPTRRMHQA